MRCQQRREPPLDAGEHEAARNLDLLLSWLTRVDRATLRVSATTFTAKHPVAATATARRALFPGNRQCLLEHLDLHSLATQQAFQLPHTVHQLADLAGRDNILVSSDRGSTAPGQKLPSLEQQARRDPLQACDGLYRHARLDRILDQGQLLLGTAAPPPLPAGDDFDPCGVLRQRRIPRR